MGGCQSAAQVPKASTVTPDKLPRSQSSSNYKVETEQSTEKSTANSNSYVGIYENLNLLCLDQFISRYTGEVMYRWRPATILYVEHDTGQVKVHYDGKDLTVMLYYVSFMFFNVCTSSLVISILKLVCVF